MPDMGDRLGAAASCVNPIGCFAEPSQAIADLAIAPAFVGRGIRAIFQRRCGGLALRGANLEPNALSASLGRQIFLIRYCLEITFWDIDTANLTFHPK
jgi:hypothetical protein